MREFRLWDGRKVGTVDGAVLGSSVGTDDTGPGVGGLVNGGSTLKGNLSVLVGELDGTNVGGSVGYAEGAVDGFKVGVADGALVGGVGVFVSPERNLTVGTAVGATDGASVGWKDGVSLGRFVGANVARIGEKLGDDEDGAFVGCCVYPVHSLAPGIRFPSADTVGRSVGVSDGVLDGKNVGTPLGDFV